MSSDFHSLTAVRPVAAGRFDATVPDGWQQGRGAFGGLVVALLVRALEASEPDTSRALRSLTAELCGPVVPGPATLSVETLRHGNGVTTLAARLTQEGEVQAHAVGVLGRARTDRPRRVSLAAPERPAWNEIAPVQLGPPFAPVFAPHFEFRNVGPEPFHGGDTPATAGWIRMHAPGPARDAAFLAAHADAWWPAIFSTDAQPRPVGTIAYTFEVVGALDGLDAAAPLFHRALAVAEHEGYFVELRELWGEDGRLVALNQQTFAVIR